jgi:RsiW-degrading membrane proteinase PrsW (M82 family)
MYWFAIALSPAIALVWFFYARNAYTPERKLLVTMLFLVGGLSALGALALNHSLEKYTQLWSGAPELSHRLLFWVLGVGLNEEFAKMAPLLLLLYPRRDFRTPYQGLLGAATVALGFAAVENLFYLERYGTVTLLTRSVLTVPAHAFFSIPMGVMMAYARNARRERTRYLWLLGGLGVSVAFHGLYDVWLSIGAAWLDWIAYLQVVLMGVLALRLMRLPPLPPREEPS